MKPITDEIRESIAQIYLEPIMERLSKEVIEEFCEEKCGHGPEGRFCMEAQRVYLELLKSYARLN